MYVGRQHRPRTLAWTLSEKDRGCFGGATRGTSGPAEGGTRRLRWNQPGSLAASASPMMKHLPEINFSSKEAHSYILHLRINFRAIRFSWVQGQEEVLQQNNPNVVFILWWESMLPSAHNPGNKNSTCLFYAKCSTRTHVFPVTSL